MNLRLLALGLAGATVGAALAGDWALVAPLGLGMLLACVVSSRPPRGGAGPGARG
ncbi:hypothetical protein [Roseomonas haemaphysalidis]|uniref:Uncharacterized protein n=1 Tax=Roseomonas haemaphysalidis TaxID=2768162 RepID=A0ABS3KJP7_9PROT|nr:hypothetical protein [Roseomonas haemaphysalidis]MBO1077694.1 hypothetical protein [Roseomonas haemaphysalidis]